jgi:hypothetical protein
MLILVELPRYNLKHCPYRVEIIFGGRGHLWLISPAILAATTRPD